MNTDYEVFTQWKQGTPILKTDLLPNVVFELGEPAQSIDGLNGFLMEVDKPVGGVEGVLDCGTSQVYNSSAVLEAGNHEVGTKLYFDPTTGSLTTVSTGDVFGKIVRTEYDEVFPIVGGVTTFVNLLLVN